MRILIKNINEIYSGKRDEIFKNAYIEITDSHISEINTMAECPKEDIYDRVIDGRGKIALPGFINTHTHAGMTLMRGYADDLPLENWLHEKIWPFEAKLKKEDIYWGSALSIVEMIKTGTTLFADMYFEMDRVAELVSKSGIRAALAEGLIEENDGEEGLKRSCEFAETWQGAANGRITTLIAPHAPYSCSTEYLNKVKKCADEKNLTIHIHVSETKTELENSIREKGMSPVKYLNEIGLFDSSVLAAHCVNLEEGDIEILAKKNVSVAHNPSSNTKLASGIAPVTNLINAGVNVAIGTDGVSSNNNLDIIEEARLASYLQKVSTSDPTAVDIWDLLKMLTVNGAKALNLKKLGLLNEGSAADVILVDVKKDTVSYPHHNNLSNLFYASHGNLVDTVIVDGEILMEKRIIKTLDVERIYHEVEKRSSWVADKV